MQALNYVLCWFVLFKTSKIFLYVMWNAKVRFHVSENLSLDQINPVCVFTGTEIAF
jgi:hypothetical protein